MPSAVPGLQQREPLCFLRSDDKQGAPRQACRPQQKPGLRNCMQADMPTELLK